MNRNYTHLLLASLVVSAVLHGGATNAADDRLWREQVARPDDSVIVLESEATDPRQMQGDDWLFWREQVKTVSKDRVFIVVPAGQGYAKTSDSRLWREQIKVVS